MSFFRVLFTALVTCASAQPILAQSQAGLPLAVANDNRTAGGVRRGDTLTLALEARLSGWRPDLDVDSVVTVLAFGEVGGQPRIPGPLLRVLQGSDVRVTVRNAVPDSTIIVHGLRAGTVAVADDTVWIEPGATREIRFRASRDGTFLYWGATSDTRLGDRAGRDAQLTGAIVVDPQHVPVDPDERIFVMTLIAIRPDTTRPPPHEEVWEAAINGWSWPHTERLHYPVGRAVRWRWLNGTDRSHPMHLHGFHFRLLAKSTFTSNVGYDSENAPLAVTEFMPTGSTMRMEWLPTRAGNWLMHCHMIPHIVPFPDRSGELRDHDLHDPTQHALRGMAGLVMGITTYDDTSLGAKASSQPAQRLRLFAQQITVRGGPGAFGYVLATDADPRPDSVVVPGSPLVLTRDSTTAITVINRLHAPTTVHWHGMELESVYDGVAGWSGVQSTLAPLLAPGDSFTVVITPPRAGTYMYHSHMDEEAQLGSGMYGPLLVLEPGERYDPATDLVFMIGRAVENGENVIALSGQSLPAPLELETGRSYRLRIASILPAAPAQVTLRADTTVLTWQPRAKDGADLPRPQQVAALARFIIGVGETYDFDWLPTEPMQAVLEVAFSRTDPPLRQVLRVRPRD